MQRYAAEVLFFGRGDWMTLELGDDTIWPFFLASLPVFPSDPGYRRPGESLKIHDYAWGHSSFRFVDHLSCPAQALILVLGRLLVCRFSSARRLCSGNLHGLCIVLISWVKMQIFFRICWWRYILSNSEEVCNIVTLHVEAFSLSFWFEAIAYLFAWVVLVLLVFFNLEACIVEFGLLMNGGVCIEYRCLDSS